jgi:PAS domain S-box-containing protein
MASEYQSPVSLEDFASIIASSVDGFALVNGSGHIVNVNDSYCRIVGYTCEELLKMHVSEIDAMDSSEDVAKRSEEIILGGSLRFETKQLRKDGTIIDVEVTANYSPLHGGLIFSFVRDITQQKLIEKAHRQSEELYKNIVEAQTDFVERFKPGGILTYVNPVLAKFAGVEAVALLGKSFYPFIHKDDREEAIRKIESISSENPIIESENRIVMPDGSIRWNQWTQTGFFDESGTIVEYQSVGKDITERKKFEVALRESEDLLAQIIEQSPISMAIVCMDGTIERINRRAIETFGYFLDDIPDMERWWVQAYPDKSYREEVITQWMGLVGKAIAEKREIERREYRVTCKDGTVKTAVIFGIPVQDKVFVLFDDITDHKKNEEEKQSLERQFQQAQKLESLGVLAGGIAHDFNNILAIIVGHCSLAALHYEKAVDHIPEIEKAATRAAELCQQMLAYAGKSLFVQNQVDLLSLVEEMVKMLKSTINQNVVIKPDLSTGIPPIKADASQIRQVVMNLIINAAESIGESQGEVKVSLAKSVIKESQSEKDYLGKIIHPGLYVCLEVTDNGCGMDNDTYTRIFEPFYTTKFTGRGLGMSAVLGIVTAHNGALQLFSQLGKGTTFKVYLPVQMSGAGKEGTLDHSSKAEPWQGSGTILLVEDEEQVMQIAKAMLYELGFNVIEARDGKEGLELYQKNAVDITMVVSDMGMPVMDGYEMIRELKKLNSELPIIISSGFGEVDVTSRIPREYISGLICKPYNFAHLSEVLKRVLYG